MEFSLYTNPLFYLIVFIVFLLSFLMFSRFFPENISRYRIKKILKNSFKNEPYHLLENVRIPEHNGLKTMITHLLVSPYGLYIIETCHHGGGIYGSHHQVKWLSKGLFHSVPFNNPHMKLSTTVETLTSYLNLTNEQCTTIVVFTTNCHFPNSLPTKTCKIKNLISTISENRSIMINPNSISGILEHLKIPPSSHNTMLNEKQKLKI